MPPPSRRSFLKALGGVGAALPAAGSALELLAAAAPAAAGEAPSWETVRAMFAFGEERVPMNAANLCPAIAAVSERVAALTRDIDGDASFQNRAKYREMLELSRSKVAAKLGVSGEEIALVRNTSEGNNVISSGFPLGAGDEVVIWEENHPTNNVAWKVRARRYGFTVKTVRVPAKPRRVEDLVEPFERALTSRTRVLTFTDISNLSGLHLPARELCELARSRGVFVHIDGAQSWGAIDLDLRRLGCDAYAGSSHKWLMGPKETGVLYVREEHHERIWPSVVSRGWDQPEEPPAGARRFESLGQRNDPCLAAIADTVDFHDASVGAARIEERVLELADRLKRGLADAGARLVTPEDRRFSGGVVIVEVPEQKRQALFERLYREHGIAGSSLGGLRLCPHVYNLEGHVDRAIHGVAESRRLLEI